MPDPLDVASGPRRRSLAQIGSGGSSFLDKDQFLSTTTWPTRRAGSSQMEQRLPSSGLHWMTCVPTRHHPCYKSLKMHTNMPKIIGKNPEIQNSEFFLAMPLSHGIACYCLQLPIGIVYNSFGRVLFF